MTDAIRPFCLSCSSLAQYCRRRNGANTVTCNLHTIMKTAHLPGNLGHAGFESTFRAGAKADLPEEHHLSQGLFSVIVRGRDSGNAQEGEEMFLFRADEECPQGPGGFEEERPFTDPLQLLDETLFDVRRIRPGNIAGFQFLPHVTGPRAELNDAVAVEL